MTSVVGRSPSQAARDDALGDRAASSQHRLYGHERDCLFICYPRQDGTFAAALDEALRSTRVLSYLSRRYFPSGGDWRPAVFRTLADSRAILLLSQPELAASGRCKEELSLAQRNGKPMIVLHRYPAALCNVLQYRPVVEIDAHRDDEVDIEAVAASLQERLDAIGLV